MPNSSRWKQSGARRGWSIREDLQHQAWLRVLQGHRPPSVQWPRVGTQQPTRQTGSSNPPLQQKSAVLPPSRLTPTEVSLEASRRVSRLERCIAQLDPADTAELKSLQAALTKARAQTILPHPGQQVEDCQAYCNRATRAFGESSGRSGGRPGGGGQVREGASGWSCRGWRS